MRSLIPFFLFQFLFSSLPSREGVGLNRFERLEKRRGGERKRVLCQEKGDSLIKDDFLLNFDSIGGAKQSHPRVGGGSEVVIAFSDTRDGNSDVQLQRFSLIGNRLGRNIRVNDDRGLKWQGEPDLCLLANGNFVLAWEDRRDCNSDVFVQIFEANGNRVGNNIRANDDETRTDQRNVSLTQLGEERFLVVWDDWRNDPGDIYGQIFANDGRRIGNNFQINEGTWLQYHPSGAADREGNFVVAWQDGRGRSWDIYARRFDQNGNPLGGDFLVNDDNTDRFQGDPEVAMGEDGSFIIVWADERAGNSDIYAQRFLSDGTRIGANFLVNEIQVGNQSQPALTLDRNGRIFCLYTDDRLGNPDIFLTIFDTLGNRLATLKINDDNTTAPQGMGALTVTEDGNIWAVWEDGREGNQDVYCQVLRETVRIGENLRVNDDSLSTHQRCPFITVSGQGEFLVAWEDERNGDIDIYCQRFDTLGNLIGENLLVNDEINLSYQFYPSTARDFSGRTLITWTDTRGGESDIYAQFFDENGNRMGDNFLVNDNQNNTQWYPIVSADSAGHFLIVWMDNRDGNWDIYGQRYFQRDPIGGNFRVNEITTGDQMYAYCAYDQFGDFLITWMDNREGNFEIYAQLYDQNGNPMGNNFKVNETSESFQGYPACAKGGNYFALAWEDEREGNVDIYAQSFLANGNRIGGNFRVNDDMTEEDQYSPSLTIAENGDIIFVWCDGRKGDGDLDIYAQRFDSTGRRIGRNLLINNPDSFPGNNQWLIGQGIKTYQNKIAFSWIDNRRHKGWDIYGKVVKLSYLSLLEDLRPLTRTNPLSPLYCPNWGKIPKGAIIYDVKGRKRENLSFLRQGVYFLEWRRGERVERRKMIKF